MNNDTLYAIADCANGFACIVQCDSVMYLNKSCKLKPHEDYYEGLYLIKFFPQDQFCTIVELKNVADFTSEGR